jgi:hypothetical protein
MTEQIYSLYFAFNALAMTLGSLLCARVLVNVESRRILLISLAGMFFFTGTLLILGKATPTNFALPMYAYSLFLGMSRPITQPSDPTTGVAGHGHGLIAIDLLQFPVRCHRHGAHLAGLVLEAHGHRRHGVGRQHDSLCRHNGHEAWEVTPFQGLLLFTS